MKDEVTGLRRVCIHTICSIGKEGKIILLDPNPMVIHQVNKIILIMCLEHIMDNIKLVLRIVAIHSCTINLLLEIRGEQDIISQSIGTMKIIRIAPCTIHHAMTQHSNQSPTMSLLLHRWADGILRAL